MPFTLKLKFSHPINNTYYLRKKILSLLQNITTQFKVRTPSAYFAYIKFQNTPRERHLKTIKQTLFNEYNKLDCIVKEN